MIDFFLKNEQFKTTKILDRWPVMHLNQWMGLFDRWTSSINDTKKHEEAEAKMLGIKLCKIMHNCING